MFRQAWDVFEKRWKTMLGILFVAYAGVGVVALAGLGGVHIWNWFQKQVQPQVSETVFFVVVAAGAILGLALLVSVLFLSLWSQIALLYAAKDHAENIDFREAFRRARGKVSPFLWLSFLNGLLIAGGLVLFIIPGVLFAIWFSLMQFVFVAEGERGLNALLKSREYVRGHFWPVAWRMLFTVAVAILATAIPARIIEIFEPRVLPQIFNYLVSMVLGPVIVLYTFFLYDSLKKLKGGVKFTPSRGAKAGIVAPFAIVIVLIPILLFLAGRTLQRNPQLQEKLRNELNKISTANPR